MTRIVLNWIISDFTDYFTRAKSEESIMNQLNALALRSQNLLNQCNLWSNKKKTVIK